MTTTADAFMAAVRHHQAGQLAEADRLYAEVLAVEPQHAHALHLRGALAHAAGRDEDAVELISRAIAIDANVPDFHYNIGLALWALNRRPEAIRHWVRAIALNPNFAQARLNLGNALREQGRYDDSIAQLRAALQLQPSPLAHNSLGLSLAKAGRDAEAVPYYTRAIALQPALIDAYLNLAMSHANRGETGDAIAVAMRSLEVRETPEGKALFARLISGFLLDRDNEPLRHLLTRALAEGWSAPALFAPTAMSLIRHGPARAPIDHAARAWPARLPAQELGRPELTALHDPLLLVLMQSTVVHDAALEKFLAGCRFALLQVAEATLGDDDEAVIGFACALARQCFINEYVYAAGADEEAHARRLRERLDAALASGSPVSPLWVASVATYFPLHALATADALISRPWPAAVGALLDQQISASREEAALRESLPQLTPIDDEVSRAVRAQYEANPYPRWITTGTPRQYPDLDSYLRELFPSARFRPLGKRGSLDILIAGCGTGQHAILTTLQHEGARTLAIDLSRASLAYAAARSRALDLDIEFAQADITRLGSLERRFDLIESVGVLHHLGDPYAGWRVLLPLLRPGGLMRIGLYSELARWGVVAARTRIAAEGHGSTAADIRRFRRELMQRDDEVSRNLLRINDFYSTSECRDLLFHTQEHRMTFPVIKQFLAEQSLHLVGLEVDRAPARKYAARFPKDPAMTDLDNWDAFERDNPATFESMYRFWVQTPAN